MSHFDFLPEEAFSILILFFPNTQLVLNKFEKITSEILWTLLWKRDINNASPPDVKEKYLEFISEYNKCENVQDKFNLSIRCSAIHLIPSLVDQGAIISLQNHSALRFAASNGYLDIIKYFIKLGVDISTAGDFLKCTKPNTVFLLAAQSNSTNILKFLIEEQNIRDPKLIATALEIAVTNGHLDTIKYLIEQGAKIPQDDYFHGCIEIHYMFHVKNHRHNAIIYNKFLEMLNFLVSKGFKLEKLNPNNRVVIRI